MLLPTLRTLLSGSMASETVQRRRLQQQPQHQHIGNGGAPSMSNGVSKENERKISLRNDPLARSVHKPQDSLFSSSSGWTNYRGFFNLSMLLLVVSNGRVALENLIKYGVLVSPLQWVERAWADFSFTNCPNVALVLASNLVILTVFTTEKLLQRGYLPEMFAAVFYPLIICIHLITPVAVTLVHQGNPLYSSGALMIFVVESLKIVSYVHVNYWCRCAERAAKAAAAAGKKGGESKIAEGEQLTSSDALSLYPGTLTLSNLYYFLLAPTLCYELAFPRSPRRRKSFLIKRTAELIFLTFLMLALIQQWVVPLVKNSMAPFSNMNISRMVERVLKLAVPNLLIWLIFFYTMFHSALNLLAEILCFADREFYRDFWNAESIQYFWKTWNIPVHRWALRHIFMPMMRNGYSKKSAIVVVFFVSAFFHEYLVSVPLHMFRLWAYYGMMAQIPLSFVTDHVVKGGRAGNIVVWLSLILGQPMCILMYVHDWYLIHYA
ncbi:hypothetical protein PMAYCL1PPCAC_28557 [Pristionchus mayeri]|uniref:O-acyltransferase n=1 Tax=Pristionchus mayeri TaxID=1317129 RepID=A0AAN5IA40_9BILA|nr:hypothetical protein PMAYCL1PPCAC_28557 [Pristionchus mayeri]